MFGDGTVQRGVEARRIVLPCVRGRRRRRRSILRVTATIIDRPSYCLLDTRITLSPTIIVVTQPREQTSMQLLRIPWEWESRSHAHLCPQLIFEGKWRAENGQKWEGEERGGIVGLSVPATTSWWSGRRRGGLGSIGRQRGRDIDASGHRRL